MTVIKLIRSVYDLFVKQFLQFDIFKIRSFANMLRYPDKAEREFYKYSEISNNFLKNEQDLLSDDKM